ncbi:MAG: lipoprotein [Lysobacterales bacterium]|jgi:predicted small lipoprotein YifL
MQRTKTMLAILACTLALAACGLRGPLYLPDEETPAQPAPEQAEDDSDRDANRA